MEECSGGPMRDLANLDFHHPYTPYDVQNQFMRTVYHVLAKGKGQIGILESPTGTGKSLSIICASLTWLRNHKSIKHESILQATREDCKDEPPWLIDQLLSRRRDELVQQWEEREERLRTAKAKETDIEERLRKRQRVANGTDAAMSRQSSEDDSDWLLTEREEIDTDSWDALSGLSRESRDVLEQLGLGGKQKREQGENHAEEEIKIYYTSRTHSQLSQFIAELRRPSFPSSLPPSLERGREADAVESVKLLPLSSRQRLCINPSVAKLGSASAINDRCIELQQPRSSKKCSFAPQKKLLSQTRHFRDAALGGLPDIEDMYRLGKSLAVCPYYGSRAAIPEAEIIALPYPLLLQQSAREALGIKLDGNVVIIDEAHNLMDAVSNVNSASVKQSELLRGRKMLGVYVQRFGKKLGSENRMNVGRLGRIIDGLTAWMEAAADFKVDHGIVNPNHLLRSKGVDQINMFELIRYIHDSKLAYKIESYADHVANDELLAMAGSRGQNSPVLHELVSFLMALTNTSSEGRIFYQKINGPMKDLRLSYLLLSPANAFSPIVSRARAVILAGGTMSPFKDYQNHLFPSISEDKVTTLSCGHVVPPENLCVWTMTGTRPSTTPFEFSYQRRGDETLMIELGLAILNICSVVPDGVVVFFPSYSYLEEVCGAWQRQSRGSSSSVWFRLQSRKTVLKESKDGSGEDILANYAQAIEGNRDGNDSNNTKGALLLSVVGGKMSEGINFSDRLGRCVIMVGLPYPNLTSPEWKAKMEYVESTILARLMDDTVQQSASKGDTIARAKQAAQEFYENACMRAVNQSIGRAIRHRDDYAAIVLADQRYDTDRIRSKLPGWIQASMADTGPERRTGLLGGLMGSLGRFFRDKNREGRHV